MYSRKITLGITSLCIVSLGVISLGIGFNVAHSSTFVESIKFIQYLDENTALEEVRNGNLDMYYFRIPSDRLEDLQSRENLKIFESTGGSYSILANPAESEEFNPFSIKEIRFALNYLVDRQLIVNELMGGFGSPIISYYGPSDPEFLTAIETLENFNFRYNPALANEIITNELEDIEAIKQDDIWYLNSKPIKITIFIRSDDPVRKSIGELLATELEKIGFMVTKSFGDLNKAFVVVYGSDPADLSWNLYTEGWARSAFVRYDAIGLSQMYAPWFSNMPGFNDPSYWNYENERIDNITQKIYGGEFHSADERAVLIDEAIDIGVNESVRVFLASKTDQYVVNKDVDGVINDFGSGITSRFTPINAHGDDESLTIGVKQIYQGAWNPVMGLTDFYSRYIWETVSDPATFKHPYSGSTIPIRAQWDVESDGIDNQIKVPADALRWNPVKGAWNKVGENITSISKITYDYEFGEWHNGIMMDMSDIWYSLYFTSEWGVQTDQDDKTFDTEFTPRATQSIETIIAAKQIDEDTIEVYVDYWHFDEGEIAEWGVLWSYVPWEITYAMEQSVLDGKVSFSRSGATSKNISWLSLLVPNDANVIKTYLSDFIVQDSIPYGLEGIIKDIDHKSRYESSIRWIEENNHAVISNGPFYLESYSPESRTISTRVFEGVYPFESGRWSEFGSTIPPSILQVRMDETILQNVESKILIETRDADSILYFLTDSKGTMIYSGEVDAKDTTEIVLSPQKLSMLDRDANNIKIFAISDTVFKPDMYEKSFIVLETEPEFDIKYAKYNSDTEANYWPIIIIIVILVAVVLYIKRNTSRRRSVSTSKDRM